MQEQVFTLSQLNSFVAGAIKQKMSNEYLLCTEIADVREVRGHCYMELLEKDEHSNTPIAKAPAKCWSSEWQLLRPAFIRTTGQEIRSGMKLLLTVYPQFHSAYGFSWIVTDIHPEFTLGELARRRNEIITQLKAAGIFHLQHQLSLPRFCQRIAVVSAESAAGYGDFVDQLHNNSYRMAFTSELFPAVMQGEQVEESIIKALDKINMRASEFDCVVIIRGGGATTDMSGFDTLPLAENVANFPLPIITGIGHERDECVLDMIACVKMKTPTAVAAFLIDHLLQVKTLVENFKEKLQRIVKERMVYEQLRLKKISDSLPIVIKMFIQQHRHKIEILHTRVNAVDPIQTLQRGFAIVRKDRHSVRDAAQLSTRDNIEITLFNGTVTATINNIKN